MQINLENSEMILKAYQPLIMATVRKFSHYETDESIDECRMIAIEAILSYDEKKGSYGNYLKTRLTYHFLNKGREKPTSSLNDLNQNGEEIITTLEDSYDLEEEILYKDKIAERLSLLDESDRRLVEMKYLKGMSNKAIGDIINRSEKTIANRISLSLGKMREWG